MYSPFRTNALAFHQKGVARLIDGSKRARPTRGSHQKKNDWKAPFSFSAWKGL